MTKHALYILFALLSFARAQAQKGTYLSLHLGQFAVRSGGFEGKFALGGDLDIAVAPWLGLHLSSRIYLMGSDCYEFDLQTFTPKYEIETDHTVPSLSIGPYLYLETYDAFGLYLVPKTGFAWHQVRGQWIGLAFNQQQTALKYTGETYLASAKSKRMWICELEAGIRGYHNNSGILLQAGIYINNISVVETFQNLQFENGDTFGYKPEKGRYILGYFVKIGVRLAKNIKK